MKPEPLSDGTRLRMNRLFAPDLRARVEQLLAERCGRNLPMCENCSARAIERLRYAVLRLSEGNLQKLEKAIGLANHDWRDLLMGAGFGYNASAHLIWLPEDRNEETAGTKSARTEPRPSE